MKTFETGGKKDLEGKAPVHLVTLKMLEGITSGLECGLKKGYEQDNWKKGLPISSAHLGAALRHIHRYLDGEDLNTETAKDGTKFTTHHLDNALTHLAMAVHQIKSGRKDLDDRSRKPSPFQRLYPDCEAYAVLNPTKEEMDGYRSGRLPVKHSEK